MKINIELTEDECKKILCDYLIKETSLDLNIKDLTFETKSKQNYKSEWETAAFRVKYNK